MYRFIVTNQPVDAEFIERLVDDVALPLLSHLPAPTSLPRPPPTRHPPEGAHDRPGRRHRPTSDAHRPQAPKHLGLALVVISTAQLMVVLDATIVNIALPRIEDDLGFSPANLQWVLTAYTLAFGGFLLLGGRAGDILGRRRVFMFGIILFTVGSLAGGFAWSEASLLVARAVQGLGAAFAAPTALSLIATEFPEGRPRNRAMGVYAAMSGAGAAIGLILGGVLTEWNWRWVLVRQRADRHLHCVRGPQGPHRDRTPPGQVRPARRSHRHARSRTAGLRLDAHVATEVITQGASGAWTDPTSLTVLGALGFSFSSRSS